MVRDYYPMLGWLEGEHLPDDQRPRTSDGRRRMRFITKDARQYIRKAEKRQRVGSLAMI